MIDRIMYGRARLPEATWAFTRSGKKLPFFFLTNYIRSHSHSLWAINQTWTVRMGEPLLVLFVGFSKANRIFSRSLGPATFFYFASHFRRRNSLLVYNFNLFIFIIRRGAKEKKSAHGIIKTCIHNFYWRFIFKSFWVFRLKSSRRKRRKYIHISQADKWNEFLLLS